MYEFCKYNNFYLFDVHCQQFGVCNSFVNFIHLFGCNQTKIIIFHSPLEILKLLTVFNNFCFQFALLQNCHFFLSQSCSNISLGVLPGAFRVLIDEYVTSDSGTGIVHNAPYFGEDDYRVCLAAKIITKDMDPVCPLDSVGRFIDPVTDFAGQYVKDADKAIIAHLKANGRLIHQAQVF